MTRVYQRVAEELRENAGQWAAYESKGNCAVLAGPGSGKTKTLTIKLARMIAEDIRAPRGIACITYSSECARELVGRLDALGIQPSQRIFIGTIHSFCLKNVVLPYASLAGFEIPQTVAVASADQRDRSLQAAINTLGLDGPPGDWRGSVALHRRSVLDRSTAEWKDAEISDLVEEYERELRKRGLIDFDGMAVLGHRLIAECDWVRKAVWGRFPIVAVDEYQDLGEPLHRIVLNLIGTGVRVFAVGDPNQSIYGFNGAKPERLKELAARADVEEVKLRFNYRCGRAIVAGSMAVLSDGEEYESKGGHEGLIRFYHCPGGPEQEAETIFKKIIPEAVKQGYELGDIAVLYVSRYEGDLLAVHAARESVPYVRIDASGAPYPKTPITRWIEDCAEWCVDGWKTGKPPLSRVLDDWSSFQYSVRSETVLRGLRRKLVEFLWVSRRGDLSVVQWLGDFKTACLDELLRREPTLADESINVDRVLASCGVGELFEDATLERFAGQRGAPDHLNLMTLHSAKGLEFGIVVMFGMDEGKIPRWNATEPQKLEARRLFYVGLTRAKAEVHLTYSGFTENRYGRRYPRGPSQFLKEVERRSRGSE